MHVAANIDRQQPRPLERLEECVPNSNSSRTGQTCSKVLILHLKVEVIPCRSNARSTADGAVQRGRPKRSHDNVWRAIVPCCYGAHGRNLPEQVKFPSKQIALLQVLTIEHYGGNAEDLMQFPKQAQKNIVTRTLAPRPESSHRLHRLRCIHRSSPSPHFYSAVPLAKNNISAVTSTF